MFCAFTFQCADCQKLETFRAVKHHLENLIARKMDAITDDHPDLKSMISTPINEWNKEAILAIEHGTNLLMDAFRLTSEEIQRSTDNIKIDIETDKKTKKP